MQKEIITIAKALSDESRLRIMMCLEGSTLCLCQLSEALGLAPSTVSQHVGVLKSAGLIDVRQEGRWHYYRWAASPASDCLRDAMSWVRSYASKDPRTEADTAKRAVVMSKSGAPSPAEAKARVMFLCTGNSCRSQMAEALLRVMSHEAFRVYSAGLDPKPIHELTYKAMDEIGIDIRHQKQKSVMEYLGKVHFGYLITVCSSAEMKCPIFPGISQRLYWPIKDPAKAEGSNEEKMNAFREAREELRERIAGWLRENGAEPHGAD